MQSLKVAILEFDYHPEVLRNTCMILQDNRMEVLIFTSKKIWNKVNLYQDIPPEEFHFFLHDPSEGSLKHFLQQHLSALNSCDLILFNTVASNYRIYYTLNIIPPILLRIHNSNAYFLPMYKTYRPRLTPFFLWKDFSHFVRKSLLKLDWYHRTKFLERVNYFIFPSEITEAYAIEKLRIPRNTTYTLPFSFMHPPASVSKTIDNNCITIAVIGIVDQRKRDYMLLYKAIKRLIPTLAQREYTIKLVLLGSASSMFGRKLSQLFSGLESEKFEFVYFKGFVSEALFVKYITESAFFILPLNINTRFTIYNEVYGYTKISGNVNDIIKHQKPALICDQYPLEEGLQLVTDTFRDAEELSSKIDSWCSERTFKNLDFQKLYEKYNFSVIRERYFLTFQEIAGLHPGKQKQSPD